MRCRSILGVEPLEARDTPAQFGNPWADPRHLRLSFVPDGVSAGGVPSDLRSVLSQTLPADVWQGAVLRAAQTWSQGANLNVGLTGDAGVAFGSAGAAQGDPRFGDIRVGGLPMGTDALAAAVPPDPLVGGTLAGDVFFNTDATFTESSLYGIALHEVGHALGLGPGTDPASVMFNTFNNNLALAPSDVAAVQALYGTRPADSNEGSGGNNSIPGATRVREPGSYDGATPLVVFGDVTTAGDVDVFEVRNQEGYSGPVTLRLQTYGVSLLAAQMGVRDEARQVVGSATGGGERGGILTVTIPQTTPDATYYVLVRAAPGVGNAVGRYSLAVTFDGLARPTATPLPNVLRGPYDTLEADEIEELFLNPGGSVYADDGGSDDDPSSAADLPETPGFPEATRYRTTGSLGSPADVDLYRVRAPQTETDTTVLTASIRAIGPNGVAPRVTVLDKDLNPVPAVILVNGNGMFTVQAAGLPANEDYLMRVADAGRAGNYSLDVSFLTAAAVPQTFTAGTVDAGATIASTLYVGRTQAFGLGLTATGPAGATVRLSVLNAAGVEVYSLSGKAGDTVTGPTALLAPGQYTLRITATGSVSFAITGGVITDPIGPQPVRSVAAPQYQDPTRPTGFRYPTGVRTLDPFLWLSWFRI